MQGCKKPWRSNTPTKLNTLDEVLQKKVVSMYVDGSVSGIGYMMSLDTD